MKTSILDFSALLDVSDGSAGYVVGVNRSTYLHRSGGHCATEIRYELGDSILCDRISPDRAPPCSLFGFPRASLECGNLYQLNNRRTHTHALSEMKRGLIIIIIIIS